MVARILWIVVALIVVLSGCTVGGRLAVHPKPALVLAVVSNNYVDVVFRFSPIADALSRQIDQPVRIVAGDIKTLRTNLSANKNAYQLLYLDPVEFCRLSEVASLTPLVSRVNRSAATSQVGFIVVPKSSSISKLDDLKDKRFAFGQWESAWQFYNVLEYFKDANFPTAYLKRPIYTGDSLAVARALAFKQADAGVVTRTWWETSRDRALSFNRLLKDDLKIIAKTQPMPEYVWAVSPDVPDNLRLKIKKILIQQFIKQSRFAAAFDAWGFVPVQEQDYSSVCERIRRIKNLPSPPSLLPLP